MKLSDLKIYVPDELFLGEGIQYFIDANGNDWFESLPEFKKPFSIAFDSAGVIRFYGADPSKFYPVGLSVIDVDSVPDGLNAMGGWVFDGVNIVPRKPTKDEFVIMAAAEKARLIALATGAIAPLQDAVDLGIATDEEAALLVEWKNFRVQLSRVDISNAPDITLPTPPAS